MIDAENSGAVSYVLSEILRSALQCMDCVTQSALPLGHNLKNDTRKGFVLNYYFFDKLKAPSSDGAFVIGASVPDNIRYSIFEKKK